MTGLLQLNPTLPVWTPLGDGDAVALIDYGHDVNTVWVVRLKGGVVKHVWSDDIRLYGNPMNGEGWDVTPPRAGANPIPAAYLPALRDAEQAMIPRDPGYAAALAQLARLIADGRLVSPQT